MKVYEKSSAAVQLIVTVSEIMNVWIFMSLKLTSTAVFALTAKTDNMK